MAEEINPEADFTSVTVPSGTDVSNMRGVPGVSDGWRRPISEIAARTAANADALNALATAFNENPQLRIDVQEFASSGNWTKPPGTVVATYVAVVGGGGGGGRGTAAPALSGGAGGQGGLSGQCVQRLFIGDALEDGATVTIGAGGAGGLGGQADGDSGSSTSIVGGVTVAADGGLGGANGADARRFRDQWLQSVLLQSLGGRGDFQNGNVSQSAESGTPGAFAGGAPGARNGSTNGGGGGGGGGWCRAAALAEDGGGGAGSVGGGGEGGIGYGAGGGGGGASASSVGSGGDGAAGFATVLTWHVASAV